MNNIINLLKKVFLIVHMYFLFSLLFPNYSSATGLYYFEDFSDGIAEGWTTTYSNNCLNNSWHIEDGMYGFKVSSNDMVNGCKTYSILTSQQIPEGANYVYEFDMKFPNTVYADRNFFIKYVDINNWYDVHLYNTMVHLEKVYNQPGVIDPFPLESYNFQAGSTYHFKISVYDNIIIIDINNDFHKVYTDSSPILQNRYIGLKASTGNTTSSEVWFDNISLSIYPSIVKFNLPINYSNRDNPSQTVFQSEFWNKMTASFDHNRERKVFTPFTRDNYDIKDCPKSALGITCYDGHNGTDFRPSVPKANEDVFPVANGKIVYASDISENGKCNSEKSGYGCVVVMYHPDLDVYTLYAHLSEINKSVGDSVVPYTESIGKMGNTGCYPCGVHIHLGTLKDKTPLEVRSKMKKSDWENLFMQVEPKSDKKDNTNPKHYCTYKVPNGNILTFQDPSGWSSETQEDPWSLSKELGGCSTDSPYLWIEDIGTTHPEGKLPRIWYSE